ncbi:TauD/TfdA family dioxygenase [Nonomuraea sp. NPDC004354]
MAGSKHTSRLAVAARTDVEAVGHPDVLLADTGALLIRGAGITDAAALVDLAARIGLTAVAQVEPFAARRDLGSGVWSQPAWPRTSPMCMHHELGWMLRPPPYLLIACRRPPASGGCTGVADGRLVLSELPERLVDRVRRHGWTLIRRYAEGPLGMSWQQAFGGLDVAGIEAYAAAEEIDLDWASDTLITRRSRPALRLTGRDRVAAWSNLLAFCSEWTLDSALREYLVSSMGQLGLPFQTTLGDGSPFTAADVETVDSAYDRVTAYVSWHAGDVLLLDNIRTAHSMTPFTGDREMLVMHAVASERA